MEEKALDFARRAHGEQKRKYTGQPYIEHPKRVAGILRMVPHTTEMICAAYLHDVVEDTPVSIEEIKSEFGEKVASLVHELTDEFMKVNYPHLNRRQRKTKEIARQAIMSDAAKTIKLADVIDNTRDIVENDKDFAPKYLREMKALTEALQGGNFNLLMKACYEIERGLKLFKSPVNQNSS